MSRQEARASEDKEEEMFLLIRTSLPLDIKVPGTGNNALPPTLHDLEATQLRRAT